MKRILSMALMLIMLAGILSFSASAKTVTDVIDGVTKEYVIIDDMYRLCETVDGGDTAKVFETVLIVYPDLVTIIKKNMNDDYAAPSSSGNIYAETDNERYAYAVTNLMQNVVFLDDLAKLTEAVSSDDSEKIFECILEIYPDFVTTLKNELGTYPGNDNAVLFLGNAAENESDEHTVLWAVCAGVVGIAVGAISAYFITKKKGDSDIRR